jgi:ABC-type transport system involved in multi-copper enzyme maturation permease subunit
MSEAAQGWFEQVVLDNPIIRREAVPRAIRRASPTVRQALVAAALIGPAVLGVYLRSVGGEFASGIGLVAVWAWAGLTVLVAALETSRAIGQERLQGTWDMLVLTRLGGRAIVAGKLLAALLPLWAVGLALFPFCLPLVYAPENPDWALHLLGAYAVATIGGTAAASLGLCCSMLFRTIFGAQLATVFAGWVAAQLLPLLVMMPMALMIADSPGVLTYGASAAIMLAPGYIALVILLTRFEHLDRRFRQGRG